MTSRTMGHEGLVVRELTARMLERMLLPGAKNSFSQEREKKRVAVGPIDEELASRASL